MLSLTEGMPFRKRIVPSMPPQSSAAGQQRFFVANGAGTM